MKGILVINAFWKSASMANMAAMLKKAAGRLCMELEIKTNADFLMTLPALHPLEAWEKPDFYLFWDKDVRLALLLEKQGALVFNAARAIALCDDKTLTHAALCDAGIPMPETILCPQTFPGVGYPESEFLSRVGAALSYPLVIKEGCGSFGQQVYLAASEADARAILSRAAGAPLLFQRFIRESAGRDIRLYMVGGRCAAAMRRVNDTDFRANIQSGGRAEPYAPTEAEMQLAARACQALGLDFAGVDLLHSQAGPLLCEVNSNAHFTALSALTGIDVAAAILAHIREAVCAAG